MIAAAFVTPFNHLLAQSEWARHRLRPHAGQVAELQLPLGSIRLAVDQGGFLGVASDDTPPALTLTIPPDALLASLSGPEAGMKHVRIAGNAEFGESLGFVLRHLEWDAEGDLARVVGDVAAPRLHRSVLGFLRWHADALRRAKDNLREYWVYERPTLVDSPNLQEFARELISLADDLARLDKRVARLAATAGRTTPAR